MKRHGKYSFTKAADDKLCEVEIPKERRDSFDRCCQTLSDWKEPTKYDINNLLQDASTEKATETSRKINSTSLTDTGKTMPNEEQKIIFKNKTITRPRTGFKIINECLNLHISNLVFN